MKTKKLLMFIAACMLLVGCEKEEDPTLSINTNTITFTKSGGEYEYRRIEVTSNTEFVVTVDATWCSIDGKVPIGRNQFEIGVAVEANPMATERTATITIQAGALQEKVTIIQEAGDVTLSVTPTFIYPETNAAGSYSINVTGNAEWTTEVEYISEKGWCTLEPSSGSGSGIIAVNLPHNPNSRRSAIITIKSREIVQTDTVIQHGVVPTEAGVTINGITWATRNVEDFGAFADLSSSPGKYYQFNGAIGYSYIDGVVVPVLNSAIGISGREWSLINDPSPEGWRIPTYEEAQNLRNSGYRYVSEDNGAWFGPDAQTASFIAPGNAVFLLKSGTLYSAIKDSNEGHYWVYSVPRDYDSMLSFETGWGNPSRRHALPIRCVKE